MTYHEFKNQLLHVLEELIAENETKKEMGSEKETVAEIGILEKDTVYEGETQRRVMEAVKMSCHGGEAMKLSMDVIYVARNQGRGNGLLYWTLRPFYEKHKAEGWQGVLPEIAMALHCENDQEGSLPTMRDTYVQCRDQLILRPMSLITCGEELSNCIYWSMGDVALVLYLLVFEDEENVVSVKLDRSMTNKWERRDDVLLTRALLNSFQRMPPRIYDARKDPSGQGVEDGVFMSGEKGRTIWINRRDHVQGKAGYRLTTTRRFNGALALFYPGVKERIYEHLGEDYYVLFMSVGEVRIFPLRHKSLAEAREELRQKNALQESRSFLTGRVYRYVHLRGELMEV